VFEYFPKISKTINPFLKEKGFFFCQLGKKEEEMERYLIVDVGVETGVKEVFAEKFGLTILDAQEMTNDLLAWQGWGHLDPWSTLIVLPGNGASIVKKHIDKAKPFWLWRWPWKASPHAKRIWLPGENPQSYVSRINRGVFVGIKTAVVIDDVISSGETVEKLRRKNMNFIPVAEWWALTWVKQRASSAKHYPVVFASRTVGSKEHKVPINSLSTLIEDPEIAESYAGRNFGNEAKDFEKILESLR
jgi:hypothetical protein